MTLRKATLLVLTLAAATLCAPALAQMDHSSHGAPAAKAAPIAASALEEGMVKKIDPASGKVSIAHAASASMPAMTMVYSVKDAALLAKMQPGQKIRFATDTPNGMTIVRSELAK